MVPWAGLRRLDLAGNCLAAVAGLPAGGSLEELCLDRNAIRALDVQSFAGELLYITVHACTGNLLANNACLYWLWQTRNKVQHA